MKVQMITLYMRQELMLAHNTVVPKLAPELVESYSLTHEDNSLDSVLAELEKDALSIADRELLKRVVTKRAARISRHDADYATLTANIAQVCLKPRTHVSICILYPFSMHLTPLVRAPVALSSVRFASIVGNSEKRSCPFQTRSSSIYQQRNLGFFYTEVVRSAVSFRPGH
jgi:hypothetical protein